MADKQIIIHGIDLNQIPLDDSLVIVPVPNALPLATVPPKLLATAKPQSYDKAYFAQVQKPTLPSPSERLLLKDSH